MRPGSPPPANACCTARWSMLKIGVPVGHEKRVSEQRQCAPERTRRAGRLWPVERVEHLDAEARSVVDRIDDLVAEMPDTEHDATSALTGEEP